MRNVGGAARLVLLVLVAGCDTGTGPGECDPSLRIAVDGGATVRFQWNSDCQENSLSEPYRDRPRGQEGT